MVSNIHEILKCSRHIPSLRVTKTLDPLSERMAQLMIFLFVSIKPLVTSISSNIVQKAPRLDAIRDENILALLIGRITCDGL